MFTEVEGTEQITYISNYEAEGELLVLKVIFNLKSFLDQSHLPIF